MNHVVHAQRRVDASPAVVFAMLADPPGWPAWSGHDRGEVVRAGEPDPAGVGSVRAFTYGRFRSVEEVVAYEPDHHLGYVLRSGLPVRGYRADVRLERDGDGAVVTWRSAFRPLVPGTGALLRRGLQRFIERALAGLAVRVANEPHDVAPSAVLPGEFRF